MIFGTCTLFSEPDWSRQPDDTQLLVLGPEKLVPALEIAVAAPENVLYIAVGWVL